LLCLYEPAHRSIGLRATGANQFANRHEPDRPACINMIRIMAHAFE
jgi:hypothetical protein